MTNDNISRFLACSSFAVVGSFRNKAKFAYRILLELSRKGKIVFPVNPRGVKVDRLKCYPTLQDIKQEVCAAVIVTPAPVTEDIVKQCKILGINNVWMQPGAESNEAIDYCIKNDINVVYNACVLMNSNKIY